MKMESSSDSENDSDKEARICSVNESYCSCFKMFDVLHVLMYER